MDLGWTLGLTPSRGCRLYRPEGTIRIAAVSLLATGCAVQLTGGATSTGQSRPVATATLGATMHALRANNGIAGARLTTAVGNGIEIKQGVVHGGYDMRIVPGRVVLEPGFDLGAGSPISRRFDGVGTYGGVSGTVRVRAYGMDDRVPAFVVISPIVEIVLAPRLGGWVGPEGSGAAAVHAEYGCELGVRIAIASDLASPEQGEVSDDPAAGAQAR
jgi:hypothetical protein